MVKPFRVIDFTLLGFHIMPLIQGYGKERKLQVTHFGAYLVLSHQLGSTHLRKGEQKCHVAIDSVFL